jgi:hypothetical protein
MFRAMPMRLNNSYSGSPVQGSNGSNDCVDLNLLRHFETHAPKEAFTWEGFFRA